jgi:hypothetical protein
LEAIAGADTRRYSDLSFASHPVLFEVNGKLLAGIDSRRSDDREVARRLKLCRLALQGSQLLIW